MHWQQSSPLALELRSRLPQHLSALLPPSFCSALPPTSPLSGKPCLFTLLPNMLFVLGLYCTKHDLLRQLCNSFLRCLPESFWPCVCAPWSSHAFRPEVSCSGCKTALCLLLVFHGAFFCCNRMRPSLPKSQIKLHALVAVHLVALMCRGFTRKEPFANGFWSTKAENWNGRVAMVGFALLIVVEALTG